MALERLAQLLLRARPFITRVAPPARSLPMPNIDLKRLELFKVEFENPQDADSVEMCGVEPDKTISYAATRNPLDPRRVMIATDHEQTRQLLSDTVKKPTV